MILLLPFFSLSIRSKPNTPAKLKFFIHFYPPRPHFLFFCCLTLQICAHTYPLRRTTSSLSHSRDRVCLNNRIASVFSICESTIFGERQSEFCDFLSTAADLPAQQVFRQGKGAGTDDLRQGDVHPTQGEENPVRRNRHTV